MKNKISNRVKTNKIFFTKPSKKQKKMLKYLNACLKEQERRIAEMKLLWNFTSYNEEHSFESFIDFLENNKLIFHPNLESFLEAGQKENNL